MRPIFLAILMLAATLAAPLRAQERVLVVVEMFTSQGCSACVSAEAMLHDLVDDPDILPLSLHVDYWDYLGWRDVFADPAFTARQHGYAAAGHQSTVYTPQIIVNGTDRLLGTRPMQIAERIAAHRAAGLPVVLRVTRQGAQVLIEAEPRTRGNYVVQLVRYLPEAVTQIDRGENAGRTIHHVNIVTDWRPLARWDGAGPIRLRAEAAGEQPVAVLIQHAGHGAIVGAAVAR